MIDRLDHFVLTTAQPDETIRFYTEVLGMKLETFREGKRLALKFGRQKINIHVKGEKYDPKAHAPGVGTLDFCFIASVPLEQVIESLNKGSRGRTPEEKAEWKQQMDAAVTVRNMANEQLKSALEDREAGPEKKPAPAPKPSGDNSNVKSPSKVPSATTKAERDALPSGTRYKAPDGKIYIKG